MLVHNKEEDMNKERKSLDQLKLWLLSSPRKECLNNIYCLSEASYEQQITGIDLIGKTFNNEITIENKIRFQPFYQDLLIETQSKKERNTPGWIDYAKAEYLIYIFIIKDYPIKGHIINLSLLQEWWKTQNPENFQLKESPNQGYVTVNRVVPLKEIPRKIFLYSNILPQILV